MKITRGRHTIARAGLDDADFDVVRDHGAALARARLGESRPALDARPRRHRREEAQAIDAVVGAVAVADDLETAARADLREQAHGQEAVGDRAAERALAPCALDVDVDPLVVARERGEAVDHVLRHEDGIAPGTELAGDLGGEGADVVVADDFHVASHQAVR
jgi:hypothetical protein